MKGIIKVFISIMIIWIIAEACPLYAQLPDGEWDKVSDSFGEVIRVNLEKITDWNKVPGIKRSWKVTGPNGESHAEHAVISEIKDVDGDGKLDLFRVSNSVLMRFDEHNNRIWKSRQLSPAADDESRMPVVDLDGDGRYECVISLTDTTYCINADNGNIKWKIFTGAEKNYSSLVVGHFDSKSKYAVAVRVQRKVLCFDYSGNRLWTCSFDAADTYGHCMGHADLDGDGYDEIFASLTQKMLVVSHEGSLLWSDNSQGNHSDWVCVGDLDKDGEIEIIYDHDGCHVAKGPIYVADGVTGQKEQSWSYSGIDDSNSATIGDFRPDLPGLEIARVDKTKGIELWDSRGKRLWYKYHACTGVSRGDWDGDGVLNILVTASGPSGGPHFSVWNGKGMRLYAIQWLPIPEGRSYGSICGPEDKRRVCPDHDKNGKADVLVAFGKWYSGENEVLCLMEAPGSNLYMKLNWLNIRQSWQ